MKKILVLASNPRGTTVLNLCREIREIKEVFKRCPNTNFTIEICVGTRPKDLRHEILAIDPQFVHFCGHGAGRSGLWLEDDDGKSQQVSTETLSELFKTLSGSIECVVLNCCYSKKQADEISKYIGYVVGMSRAVKDNTAIEFAAGFYDGIANGKSIQQSFDIGKLNVQLEIDKTSEKARKFSAEEEKDLKLSEYSTPVLLKNDNLGITVECEDPQPYTGRIWTLIIPESNNFNKRHHITIKWGSFYWEKAEIISEEGILLLYEKRHQDLSTRFITVAPSHKPYPDDGVIKITDHTKINNGHLNLPKTKAIQIDINQNEGRDWYKAI